MVRVSPKALLPREYVFEGIPKERRAALKREILALRQREIEAEHEERAARLARSRAAAAAHAAGVVRQAKERERITQSAEYKKLEAELESLQKRRNALGKRMKELLEEKEREDERKAKMSRRVDVNTEKRGGSHIAPSLIGGSEKKREGEKPSMAPPSNNASKPGASASVPYNRPSLPDIRSVPAGSAKRDNLPILQSRPPPSIPRSRGQTGAPTVDIGIVSSVRLTGSEQTVRASNMRGSESR